MAFERLTDGLTGLGVPQSEGLDPDCRKRCGVPSATEGNAGYMDSRMALERLADWLAGIGVP